MAHRTHSALVAFLYELVRDHVPLSVVEDIVAQDEDRGIGAFVLTDEKLARTVEALALRILRLPPLNQDKETAK